MISFDESLRQHLRSDPEEARIWAEEEPSWKAAELVIRLRSQLRLTQQELADRAGVKRSFVARIEAGKGNPTVRTLGKLLIPFGLSLTLRAERPFWAEEAATPARAEPAAAGRREGRPRRPKRTKVPVAAG